MLAYLDFPEEHRGRIRTNNVQERRNRETSRWVRTVQGLPSEVSLVRLAGTVCREASAIEGLWERGAFPAADPTGKRVTRARSRAIALLGLDEGAPAA